MAIPFTGRIKSIGTDSYGIICDADHYTTDLFSIPRSNDEIFVPQNICFRTGEIVPLRYRNSNVYIGTKFADTINAYQQLLKKTIFPCLSTATNHCDQFIEFIPGKHLFKFTDDYDYYMYIQTGDEIVTLMNLNDTTKTKIPNWKYQPKVKRRFHENGMVDERHIDKVLELLPNTCMCDVDIVHRSNIVYDSNTYKEVTRKLLPMSNVEYEHIPEMFIRSLYCGALV